MQPPELTLIVAATRNMGIGAHGSMPWQGLRNELRYFSRVTSRVPPPPPSAQSPPSPPVNAVIMGRKTWDSIPASHRPLKNRLNIVITRAAPTTPASAAPILDEPLRVASLDAALDYARARHADGALARVFVIGGAQIYAAALAHPAARRLLLTAIDADFDCDTFFPVNPAEAHPWTRCDADRLREWTGETLDSLRNEENGIPYEFQMWERREP